MQRGERGEDTESGYESPFPRDQSRRGRTEGTEGTEGTEFEFHVWVFFLILCDGHIHGYPSIMKGGRGCFYFAFFSFPISLSHITKDMVDTGEKRISDGTLLSRSFGLI